MVAANDTARRSGVHAGLRFPDARARIPDLLSEEADREADRKALEKLADWLVRISPLIAMDGMDGLMIEATGCTHLYGGEDGMMQTVSRLLSRDGLPHQLAMAGTPGAAGAMARARSGQVIAEGEEAGALADLPVGLLRISDAAETLLRRFGLTRIGQLYGIDRRALARRFHSRAEADAVVLRLDQALGLRHEPITPIRPPPDYFETLQCPEPLLSGDGIRAGLDTLTKALCDRLKALGQGGRGYTLAAYRSDGSVKRASVQLARPSALPGHICRLFAEQIDRIDPGFGIDLLMLEAHRVGGLNPSAPALSGDLAARDFDAEALSALADRISARLGGEAVKVACGFESHLPEQSENWNRFEGAFADTVVNTRSGPRPIRLFASPERLRVLAEVPDGPPEQFVWRKITRRIVRADGPERIAPEWWRYVAPPPIAPSPEGTNRHWLAPRADPRADAGVIVKARAEIEADLDLDTRPLAVRASAFTAGLEPSEPTLPGVFEIAPKSCEQTAEREQVERVWLRRQEADAEAKAELRSALPRARDYYRIEDREGRRYWVFREGLYEDGRGGPPEWFIHGVFA